MFKRTRQTVAMAVIAIATSSELAETAHTTDDRFGRSAKMKA